MAQTEMNCLDCGHMEFDNFIRTCCPACTSERICINADEDFNRNDNEETEIEEASDADAP